MLQLKSEFFKRKDAEISIYTSIGHLLKSVEPKNTVTIEKYFFTAYDKDSTNVFTLNTIAYYFSDRKHQSDAEFYIKKALEINPSDGNLYDTYADILLSFNDTTTVFWDTFEKVLKNPKPIDGITMESYRFDPRWEVLYPNDKFRNLMCRYGAGAFCPQKEIGIQKSSPLATLHKPTPKPHALNRLAPKK